MAQPSQNFYRVKVYRLNDTGGWDDKGTGLASVGPLEAPHAHASLGLVVLAEDTHKTLLAHRICTDEDIYHRQDDTIITWNDVDVGTDVALSFQEATGCHAIWQHIAQLQNENGRPGRRRVVDEFESAGQVMEGEHDGPEGGGGGGGLVELPPAEMGRLEDIAAALAAVPPMQRERVAQQIMAPGYLRALLDLFKQAEDLEDAPSLAALFQITRAAVLLNDTALLEALLQEAHVMDVMGALEYDPEAPPGARPQHRRFLRECVVFKQVVPIDSAETLAKIHQTYRIQYLKDVVLPRCLDDATYATLTSLALFNNVDVLGALQADGRFLPRLFAALKETGPGAPEWGDLVAFLQELGTLSKHLQLTQRQALWSKMQQLGLFDVITKVISAGSAAVKLRATDILLSTLGHDPLPLRGFLTRQPGHELLSLLVRELLGAPDDSGLPEQIAELLKMLVDPETLEGAPEKSEFLEVFYDRYMDVLVAGVSGDRELGSAGAAGGGGAGGGGGRGGGGAALLPAGPVPASTIGLIVDLLCYCVQHHQFRAKYHVLRKNVVEKVLKLLRRRERWLVAAGVRFLRTCVGTRDDFYTRYLVRNNLLEPLMGAFFDNGPRYNLVNSAVLELVEFVRKENIKELISWLVEHFGARFDEVDYVDTFKQVRVKYEQALEKAEAPGGGGGGGPSGAGGGGGAGAAARGGGGGGGGRPPQRWRRGERELDRDEEDYFSSDGGGDGDGDADGDGGGDGGSGGGGGGGGAAAAGPSQPPRAPGGAQQQWPPGGAPGAGAAARRQQGAGGVRDTGSPPRAAPAHGPRPGNSGAGGGGAGGGGGDGGGDAGSWLSSLAGYGEGDDEDDGGGGDEARPSPSGRGQPAAGAGAGGAAAATGAPPAQQQQQQQSPQRPPPCGDAGSGGGAARAAPSGAPQQQAAEQAQEQGRQVSPPPQQPQQQQPPLKRTSEGNGLSPDGKRPRVEEQAAGA